MPGLDDAYDAALANAFAPSRHRASTRRFFVSTTRADGTTDNGYADGGTSIDHAQRAMEEAGAGGVVRIVPLEAA